MEPGPLRMSRRKGSRQREGSPWLSGMDDTSLWQGEGSEGHPPAGWAAAGAGHCCNIPCVGPVGAGLIETAVSVSCVVLCRCRDAKTGRRGEELVVCKCFYEKAYSNINSLQREEE